MKYVIKHYELNLFQTIESEDCFATEPRKAKTFDSRESAIEWAWLNGLNSLTWDVVKLDGIFLLPIKKEVPIEKNDKCRIDGIEKRMDILELAVLGKNK